MNPSEVYLISRKLRNKLCYDVKYCPTSVQANGAPLVQIKLKTVVSNTCVNGH